MLMRVLTYLHLLTCDFVCILYRIVDRAMMAERHRLLIQEKKEREDNERRVQRELEDRERERKEEEERQRQRKRSPYANSDSSDLSDGARYVCCMSVHCHMQQSMEVYICIRTCNRI